MMNGVGQQDVIVSGVQRRNNDRDGNPRFRLMLRGGLIVMVDGQTAYKVNDTWRQQPVTLTFGDDGRVTDIAVPE